MTGFLDLPSEVRHIIYKHLIPRQHLVSDLSLANYFHQEDFLDRSLDSELPTVSSDVHLVNRLTHLETLPLLYGRKSFYLRSNNDTLWLKQIGQTNRDALRRVTVTIQHLNDFRPALKFFNLLSQCANVDLTIHTTLRELVIADSWWFGAFRNLHGFRDVAIAFEQPLRALDGSVTFGLNAMRNIWSGIEQRLEAGRQKLLSQCPKSCGLHPNHTRDQRTATLRFQLTFEDSKVVELGCVRCACKEFYYKERCCPFCDPRHEFRGDSSGFGGQSIFKLKGDGRRSWDEALRVIAEEGWCRH